MSGGSTIAETKGSKGQKKRDNEVRNLATVPRIYMGGATARKIIHKVTPDIIPGGVLPSFGDMIQRHTLNVQRELLCISAAMRHKTDPGTYPTIRFVPAAFYDCTLSELETRGTFLASLEGQKGKMYHFPDKSEEPVEKKARKSLAPAQEHDREVRPLFSGQDIQPPRPSQEYYPHDHFGSDPRYFGFNKQRFIPNQERSEHHLSL